VLFKAKNITDPKTREEKIDKARPIAPTFAHPMRSLLHLVGKAWYFMAKTMQGEHFIINSTQDVPYFLDAINTETDGGDSEAKVLDIEGCYPNMPKDKIQFAMREIVQDAIKQGKQGVSVPIQYLSES